MRVGIIGVSGIECQHEYLYQIFVPINPEIFHRLRENIELLVVLKEKSKGSPKSAGFNLWAPWISRIFTRSAQTVNKAVDLKTNVKWALPLGMTPLFKWRLLMSDRPVREQSVRGEQISKQGEVLWLRLHSGTHIVAGGSFPREAAQSKCAPTSCRLIGWHKANAC